MNTLRRLFSFLLPSWQWLLLSILLGSLTVASGIALLATSAWLISAAALHPSVAELQVAIVGVRFFGISRGVFRYLERLTSHETTFRLLSRIRTWFYNTLEPRVPAGLGGSRSGDILSSFLADIATLENFYLRILAPPLVAIVVIFGLWIYMTSLDPLLTLTLLLVLLSVGLGLSTLIFIRGRKPGRELVSSRSEMNANLVETLQGLPDLLIYDALPDRMQKMESSQSSLAAAQKKMNLNAALQSSLQVFLSGMGYWLVLLIGINLVSSGQLPGTFLAVVVLIAMASFEAVQALPLAAGHLESSFQAARRLFTMAENPPPVMDSPAAKTAISNPHLKIKDLKFTYPDANPHSPTLDSISLDLPTGKHIAILGASGNGKSTLLQILMRFWEIKPDQIMFNSEDIHGYAQESVRACFSYLPQEIFLFHTSLKENLLVSDPAADDQRIQHALQLACLDEFVDSLPHGLETVIGERGLTLSGGEKQRLGLARMLLKKAPIYLLDEPTAQLDTRLELKIIDNIQTSLNDQSVIWVTQRLVGLDWFDEILVFKNGRVEQCGSPADLLAQDGLYRRMQQAHSGGYPLQDL